MLNITKLKTFLVAAEYLNFSKAAVDLHLSQPTISHHIKSLEQELGIQLFHRDGTNLELTDAGKILMVSARKIMESTNDMIELVSSLQTGIAGELTIACSTTAGKYVLPQLAARFCEKFPRIKVRILSCMPEYISRQVLGEEANLGVVSTEIVNPALEYQVFFQDVVHLIVPAKHPWVRRENVEPHELINEPIIMREITSGTRRVMLSQLAKFDISESELNVFLELGNAEAIVSTVAAGYGIAFVSNLAASCPMERNDVAFVPIKGMNLKRTIYMARKKLSAPNRVQDVFWSFVHNETNKDLLSLPAEG